MVAGTMISVAVSACAGVTSGTADTESANPMSVTREPRMKA
jgi:hypothetical protein